MTERAHHPKPGTARYLAPFLVLLCLAACLHGADEPFLVDLTKATNAGIEDDGVADNGEGGWSDEGINDMYLYPPLKLGKVSQYGYTFHVIDPAQNGGKSVIILKGTTRGQSKPEAATVPVPNVRGKFLYLLLNAVGSSRGQPKNHVAATCTVKYADGGESVLNLRDGIELRGWWGSSNSKRLAWPFHLGVNVYAIKWKCTIGSGRPSGRTHLRTSRSRL